MTTSAADEHHEESVGRRRRTAGVWPVSAIDDRDLGGESVAALEDRAGRPRSAGPAGRDRRRAPPGSGSVVGGRGPAARSVADRGGRSVRSSRRVVRRPPPGARGCRPVLDEGHDELVAGEVEERGVAAEGLQDRDTVGEPVDGARTRGPGAGRGGCRSAGSPARARGPGRRGPGAGRGRCRGRTRAWDRPPCDGRRRHGAGSPAHLVNPRSAAVPTDGAQRTS